MFCFFFLNMKEWLLLDLPLQFIIISYFCWTLSILFLHYVFLQHLQWPGLWKEVFLMFRKSIRFLKKWNDDTSSKMGKNTYKQQKSPSKFYHRPRIRLFIYCALLHCSEESSGYDFFNKICKYRS